MASPKAGPRMSRTRERDSLGGDVQCVQPGASRRAERQRDFVIVRLSELTGLDYTRGSAGHDSSSASGDAHLPGGGAAVRVVARTFQQRPARGSAAPAPLSEQDLGDYQVGHLLVPALGDAVEGQAETLGFAGPQVARLSAGDSHALTQHYLAIGVSEYAVDFH